jgi:hypothetical protein
VGSNPTPATIIRKMVEWLQKVKNIGEGWLNVALKEIGIPDPEVEKQAAERAIHCIVCEHITNEKKCNKCGCPIIAKVRAPDDKCPESKWPG